MDFSFQLYPVSMCVGVYVCGVVVDCILHIPVLKKQADYPYLCPGLLKWILVVNERERVNGKDIWYGLLLANVLVETDYISCRLTLNKDVQTSPGHKNTPFRQQNII